MATKRPFMKMSPAVSKGLSKAKNAPARTYGANPKSAKGLGTGKGLPVTNTGPKPNVGAQNAKNAARAGRKAANPKSLRSAVNSRVMTQAEAVEQATVRRAGVQAGNKAARSSIPAGKQLVPSSGSKALVPSSSGGKALVPSGSGSKALTVGRSAAQSGGRGLGRRVAVGAARAAIGNPITGLQVAAVSSVPAWNDYSKKSGFGAADVKNDWSNTSNARMSAGKPADGKGTSTGSRSRGGARRSTVQNVPATPSVAKAAPAVSVSAPAASKPKATPTMTRGSMKRPEGSVKVDDVQNTFSAPSNSAAAPAKKKDISIGGLVGRTDGKWHLRKKVGKG